MSTQIRKFRNEDVKEVFTVIKKGFRSVISKNYTEESIENQIVENSPKNILKKALKIKYYVAVERGKIIGFGGYSKEKVHTFFVLPEKQGKGIGGKILERVFKDAKKDGIKSLKCWSTFNAQKFYESFGFKKIKKLNFKIKNTPISFIEMVKEP